MARLSQEHWLIGAALTRMLLGAWAVYYYLLHYPVRHFLWGPKGIWPYKKFVEEQPFLSVWQLNASPLFFEAVYLSGILIALAYTVGLWPRVMGVLHWVMIWSLQERNQLITDGGDNIMRIVLLFLILVNTGACLAIGGSRGSRRMPAVLREVLAVAHNFGILLVLGQLAVLYTSTGLYKAMGELWQNGTALYYILRVDEFSWPAGAAFIYGNPYLVVLGTYGTVLFEVLFAPSLLNRWTRYAVIAAGVGFHVGIAVFMGLVTFGWSMLSLYPLLLTDSEYRALRAWLVRRLGLIVFYDGWCPLCTRSVRWLAALDLLSLVQFVSLRDPGVLERYGVDAGDAARRMQCVGRSGKVREGADTLIAIAVRSPVLLPVLPLLVAGRLIGGQRCYDAVASRRFVLVPGACEGHCDVAVAAEGTQPAGRLDRMPR
ncbi:MAG: DCC1-like thiol-disulfide oxidoreductase family protein [Armatimonadota bacterium]|nr:DCC1-like thiol-disulfide oxidoreductase family protein [Armatimonadota bacterium]